MGSVRFLLVVLCGVGLLSGGASGKQPEDVFGNATRIQGWLATYRDDPQPHRVPVLLKAMAA